MLLRGSNIFITLFTTSRKEKMKKVILSVISVIIFVKAVIIFLPVLFSLFAKDIPPIDDSDLQLKFVSVSASDNAYFDLIKLESIVYKPEAKSSLILNMIRGKSWDNLLAEEIVSRNSKAYEYFAAAARKPKFQDPAFSDPSKISAEAKLPPMASWRKMALLSAIRALYLARQGRDAEAIDEALNSVKIGQKIQDSQAPLIEYMVATDMKGVGLEAMQKIVLQSKLYPAKLIRYVNELNQFYKNEDGLVTSLKGEYQIQSKSVDLLAKGIANGQRDLTEISAVLKGYPIDYPKLGRFFYFQPNKTKAMFAENARRGIKDANKPCGKVKADGVPKLAPSMPWFFITENAIGKILHDIVVVGLGSVKIRKCEDDLLVAATQAIFAIKAYHNDNNNYPTSLNELVPRYLSSVPFDPFDGKPLRYSREKKILYSVGQEMKDHGGSIGDHWRQMANPTFKIDF